jgi:hypothetical protein
MHKETVFSGRSETLHQKGVIPILCRGLGLGILNKENGAAKSVKRVARKSPFNTVPDGPKLASPAMIQSFETYFSPGVRVRKHAFAGLVNLNVIEFFASCVCRPHRPWLSWRESSFRLSAALFAELGL